jgi:transcriptional regulator with XRE-family HTH domain
MAHSFARLLKKALDRKGWNQNYLAKRMRVHPMTVSNWVTGKCEPRDEQRKRLARLLGAPEPMPGNLNGRSRPYEQNGALRKWLEDILKKRRLSVPEFADQAGVTPATIYRILNSEAFAYYPQQSTIRKIEEAAGEKIPQSTVQEIERESHIEAFGQIKDIENLDSDEDIPNKPGIYVFYSKYEFPVYAGQTDNFRQRLNQHRNKSPWYDPHFVASARFIEIIDEGLRSQAEDLLLRCFGPILVFNKHKRNGAMDDL